MLAFRRIPVCATRTLGHRTFFPFLGLGSLFEELDQSYAVGPRVSVKGAKDSVALEFEVPRFKADELKITARNGRLTVSGSKAANPAAESHQMLFGDTPARSFTRSFAVPEQWDLSRLKAELDHGIYTITIPRVVEPEPEQLREHEAARNAAESKLSESAPAAPAQTDVKVQTTSNSPTLIDNLSKMTWPPRVKVDDSPSNVKFTLTLPESVSKENLDLSLQGRRLNVGVHHTQRVEKKDSNGRVVFSESQSVSYSTPVIVPEGTRAADIATSLERGVLTISVAKHGEAAQEIKVN